MKPTEAPRNKREKEKRKKIHRVDMWMEPWNTFHNSLLLCFVFASVCQVSIDAHRPVPLDLEYFFHSKLDLNGFIATVLGQPEATWLVPGAFSLTDPWKWTRFGDMDCSPDKPRHRPRRTVSSARLVRWIHGITFRNVKGSLVFGNGSDWRWWPR